MALINVNPTRMEMQKLQSKLLIAEKGHKLLKEKRDALTGTFARLAEEARKKRHEIDVEMNMITEQYYLSSINSDDRDIQNLLQNSQAEVSLLVSHRHDKGVQYPTYQIVNQDDGETDQIQSYSLIMSQVFLDKINEYYRVFLPALIELAEIEKRTQILASELKTIRRQVNSLEFRTIPNIKETILMIKNRINDLERAQIARISRLK